MVASSSSSSSSSRLPPSLVSRGSEGRRRLTPMSMRRRGGQQEGSYDPLDLSSSIQHLRTDATKEEEKVSLSSSSTTDLVPILAALAVPLVAWSTTPEYAIAADATGSVIPSALAAYGHYLSIMSISACILLERVIIKPNMSDEEEDILAITDTSLGVFGALLAYTGYVRVVDYGKGWDFYSHEPIFWLKITFVGIFGAASFFNTTKVIQRSIAKRNNDGVVPVPMSDMLAARMIQICNAELVALACIPLTATLMARGVFYTNDIPWQIGACVSVIVFGGLSYKYVREALTWTEEEEMEEEEGWTETEY